MTFNASKYQTEYQKEKCDRIQILVKKGGKEKLKNYIKENDIKSINSLFKTLIKKETGIDL